MTQEARPTACPSSVSLREVVLRDGIQQEKILIPLDRKLALIDMLVAAGVRDMEIASFVHAAKVPAMADADELFSRIAGIAGVTFSALVFNEKGLDRAQRARAHEVAVFVNASDTHSVRNMGKGTRDALSEAVRLIPKARKAGMRVRAGVSNAFGCVLEGPIPIQRVLGIVEELLEQGPDEVGLADTSGSAHPGQVWEMIPPCRERLEGKRLSLHLHNAGGWAIANVLAALELGVDCFDTALGGTGGCPFLPGAAGNLATELVNSFLIAMNIETGIDSRRLAQCSLMLNDIIGR